MPRKKNNIVVRLWERSPLVTVLLIGATGVAGYFLLKKIFGDEGTPDEKQLPDSGKGIPIGWTARPYSTALYSALKGYPGNISEKALIIERLISLTNDQLIAVYNDFNLLYYKEGEGTMLQWLRDENFSPNNIDVLINRLMLLNCA